MWNYEGLDRVYVQKKQKNVEKQVEHVEFCQKNNLLLKICENH